MFLRNHWYVAAWSEDVGRTPLRRVLLGESVCLFRKEDGTPIALEDRCPHRNLPLSEGKLIGDVLQCGYHGLEFAHDGVCSHVPGQSAIPSWARVKSYPIVERDLWLFVWMGDPAKADYLTIPNFHENLSNPDWDVVTGQAYVTAGYRLVLDNLLDLSHLAYVHTSSTGSSQVAEDALLTTEVHGDFVEITRWMENIPPAKAFIEFADYIDTEHMNRWQFSRFIPPAYIYVCNGSTKTKAGASVADCSTDLGQWGYQIFHAETPETETTTHQFWAEAHPREHIVSDKLQGFQDAMRNIVNEDLDIYIAQQSAIDLDTEALDRDANPRGTLAADSALLEMRRIIRRLYGEEQMLAS